MLEIWAEKYRPKRFEEMINQKHVVERVRAFTKARSVPHMLFAGPAGVGKCISESTPVFTSKGLKSVGMLREGDRILSLSPSGKFKFEKVRRVLKRVDKCLALTTFCGVNVKVTPEHPFLVLENGIPKWKEARELRVGDLVAVPREIDADYEPPLEFSKVKNLWAELEKPQTIKIYKLFDGTKQKMLRILWKNSLSPKEIAEITGLKIGTVRWALKELRKAKIVRKVGTKYEIVSRIVKNKIIPYKCVRDEKAIKCVAMRDKFHGFSSWIKVFEDSREFYEWLGYVLADGYISDSRITFHNTNKILLKRFEKLSYQLFGIKPVLYANKAIIRHNPTLVNILQQLFDLYVGKKKSYNITVPERLFVAEKDKAASFIRAYFDCNGSFTDGVIEISSNSRRMLVGLKILLLKWGIISYIRSCKNHFKLIVSGSEFVRKFSENIGSRIRKITINPQPSTNVDVMLFACKEVRYVMDKLLLTYRDLAMNEKELKYLFRRGWGSYEKICSIYEKLLERCRQKIENLLKMLEKLEMMNLSMMEIEGCIESVLELIDDAKLRRKIEKLSNLRSDRLLEYNRGRRKPSVGSLLKIVSALHLLNVLDRKSYEKLMGLKFVVSTIKDALNLVGMSYSEALKLVNLCPGNLSFEMRRETFSLLTIKPLFQLCKILQAKISQLLFDHKLIEILEMLDFLVKAKVFWDRVKEIKEGDFGVVYDIEIEHSHNFVGGDGLIILHNTTLALVLAKELYGKNWRQNILQLNASDQRGIDVIRGQVKDFARSKAIGNVPFKIILLDEADALTPEAQQALRQTMENFSRITKFILIANFSSKIIQPIQSRCAIFRFRALSEDDVRKFIHRIVEGEKLKISEDGIKAIIEISMGDLRKVANLLQASAALNKKITGDVVYEVASKAKPTDVKYMLTLLLDGKFKDARKKLQDMLLRQGLAGSDIITEIHRQIYSLPISEEDKIAMIERTGEYEFRISEGGNELIQLTALLAQFYSILRNK